MFKKSDQPSEHQSATVTPSASAGTVLEQPPNLVAPSASEAIPDWLAARLKKFDQACSSGRKIFESKELQYEDAIASTGVLGASVEIVGLAARVRKLSLRSPEAGKMNKAELMEVFKDLHNYAIIGMLMVADDNWMP